MTIIKEGRSSYGRCWVEDHGSYFIVVTMDGKTKRGPYSTLQAALEEYSHYCAD